MKYTTVRVKCSDDLISEIDDFISDLDVCNEAMIEFLLEVKEGVQEKLFSVNRRKEKSDDIMYAEFFMTLPKSVRDIAKEYISSKESDHSELCLLFENIVRVKEHLFKR